MVASVAAGVGLLALFLYGLFYMFLMGSSPGDHPALDSFIQSTLGKGGHSDFLNSVLTWGYVKATFRRFFATYWAYATTTQARLGRRAPDARVVSLDGQVTRLHDVLAEAPRGVPVVLSMGSYT